MIFGPQNFQTMNETDVREEIVSRLLRRLKYKRDTKANIITESPLKYPRIQMGRKKPKKDPPLKGIADYILEVDDKFRWVIEAKAGTHKIVPDDVEQAFSYANHPEVKAIYYVITNGVEFVVYQTNHGPSAQPIISLKYEEWADEFNQIDQLLSPEFVRIAYSENTVTNALEKEALLIERQDRRIKVDKVDVIDGMKHVKISSRDPSDLMKLKFNSKGMDATDRIDYGARHRVGHKSF